MADSDLKQVELQETINPYLAKELTYASFDNRPFRLRQIENSVDRIEEHVYNGAQMCFYPRPHAEDDHGLKKMMHSRLLELYKEGFAFVSTSMAACCDIPMLPNSTGANLDTFLLVPGRPGCLFTVVKEKTTSRTKRKALQYTLSLVKGVVKAVRRFSDEHFSVVYGVMNETDLVSDDTFKMALQKMEDSTAKWSVPITLTMSNEKYKKIVHSFLLSMSTTGCVSPEEDGSRWCLTLDQFRILIEYIDETNVLVKTRPHCGGTVLMLEVAHRLGKLGTTTLVVKSEEIMQLAKKKGLHTQELEEWLEQTISTSGPTVQNLIISCSAENLSSIQATKSTAVRRWLFMKAKCEEGEVFETWLKENGFSSKSIIKILEEGFVTSDELTSLDKDDILHINLPLAQQKLLENVILCSVCGKRNGSQIKTDNWTGTAEESFSERILSAAADLSLGNNESVESGSSKMPIREGETFETWLKSQGFTEASIRKITEEEFSNVTQLYSLESSDIRRLYLTLAQRKLLEKVSRSLPLGQEHCLEPVDIGDFRTWLNQEGFTDDSITKITKEDFSEAHELLSLVKEDIVSLNLKLVQQKLLERVVLLHCSQVTYHKLTTVPTETATEKDNRRRVELTVRPDPIGSSQSEFPPVITGDTEMVELSKADEIRVVLVGSVGSGKSSTGNTIAGEKVFDSETNCRSVTKTCASHQCTRFKMKMRIIDVPGFDDTEMEESSLRNEITSCIEKASPGIHAFLFVIKIGPYTEQDGRTLKKFREYFGKAALNYVIAVFTRLDDTEDEEKDLEDFLSNRGGQLKDFLGMVSDRYVGVNNKKSSNKRFITGLQKQIFELIEANQKNCYTGEHLKREINEDEREKNLSSTQMHELL